MTPAPLSNAETARIAPGGGLATCNVLALSVALALSATAAPARAAGLFDRPAVDAERLATVRGGFSAADGDLAVSFGLQRSVLADGAPVAQAVDGAMLLVVQRGANNAVAIAPGATSATTVIQNSLDNQKLQAITTLDVATNSLQVFRGAALAAQLRSSLTDAIRR